MRLDQEAPGDEDVAISEAAAEAAARGIVGIVDLEMARNLHGWTRRMSQGLRAFRVRSGFYPDEFDERLGMGLTGGDVIPDTGGLLTVGALKIITDGSLNTRTAFCHDPYASGSHGVLTYSPEQTTALLQRAVATGYDVAVHAIGDAAVTHALDAFAATGARGTIEHAQARERRGHRPLRRALGWWRQFSPSICGTTGTRASESGRVAPTAPSRSVRCVTQGRTSFLGPMHPCLR
ncbi:hypothetical protein GCM10025876_37940 [Demequina litorisediminis]|uniref:Amidohydrolase 3 domain-containing protein n=1 Tax=Demequina litorisediminis TaxID=1849022 RepID=A0ABQ6IJW4_9MICO|nr:hypothetical protein GCM10025876_37940 [Demequina litorisediminis]